MLIHAWIYPGLPACSAVSEYTDGRSIDVLKPQYMTLQPDGTLQIDTVVSSGCNAYTTENAALIKKYSVQQYVTLSGKSIGLAALCASQQKINACIEEIISFIQLLGFTGIELDIEEYAKWSQSQYQAYLSFVLLLTKACHAQNILVALIGPAIPDQNYQAYYQWKWQDFACVDVCTVMAYDYMYDYGAGQPVSPIPWIQAICASMKAVLPAEKICIGLNSYGYSGQIGKYAITELTYGQLLFLVDIATAQRDQRSSEMMCIQNGCVYNYSDTVTLDTKLQVVSSAGIAQISVWHLGGGNQWFSETSRHQLTQTQYTALVEAATLLWPQKFS